MSQEMSCLNWKSYESQITTTFQDLFNENDFSDVTFVCDDQTKLPAHKIVLSTCSPVLRQILLDNPEDISLIYLSCVKHSEMQSILQFMYLGQVTISQDRMKECMDIAKVLQIDGISQEGGDEMKIDKNLKEMSNNIKNCTLVDKTKYVSSTSDELMSFDTQKYKASCSSAVENSGQLHNSKKFGKDFASRVDNDLFKNKDGSVIYYCNMCDYKAKGQRSFKRHQESDHEGVRYSCNQCEYQAKRKNTLKTHQMSKHEGIGYSCDQCKYQATTRSSLKLHKGYKHEGIIYSCNKCMYQASTQGNLKKGYC